MALPKGKISKSRGRMRRANWKLSAPGIVKCPRCGKMTMDAESVTRNALSRRATVYICDACGMQEALEDMMDSITPLTAWAIVAAPENWRMEEGG